MFNILVMADSRGRGLEAKIMKKLHAMEQFDIRVKVETNSGATITSLLDIALDYLSRNYYDIMVVIVGVNDLTNLHVDYLGNRRISPRFNEVGNILEVLIPRFEIFKDLIGRIAKHRMVFATMIGASFEIHNNVPGDYGLNQQALNEAVPLINEILMDINAETCFPTPKLADSVHVIRRRHYTARYRTMPDGLHPDATAQKEWSTILACNAVVLRDTYQRHNPQE